MVSINIWELRKNSGKGKKSSIILCTEVKTCLHPKSQSQICEETHKNEGGHKESDFLFMENDILQKDF